ncbi:MAG TPA: HEAT repeat domain-containing protein [Candidatus Acidoferrum sp.]|nr:HEAT repeat domain-containing protein [Candidatus Acidoferrum sp.]
MFLYESFVTLILAVALVGSQPISQNNEGQGPLPTFGELLKRHNIQLTQPALVDALRNTDPQVRYLAANKLAEDKAVETIPAIKDALASEKVPWTRMNIAFALAVLGESTGFDALEANCRNHDLPAAIRTSSAGYMINLNHESTVCLRATLDLLESGTNGDRIEAVSLLPGFHNLSKEDSGKVFMGLVEALHAPDPAVRVAAGRALADFGDTRGIAELGRAIEGEQEQVVRSQLEEDLKMLRHKIRQ